MEIKKDSIVNIEYTLKNEKGDVIDTSKDMGPLEYLHGYGNLIPGLEKELEGKKAGDSLTVAIKPEDGYGEYSDELVVEVPKANFEVDAEIEVGMQFEAGPRIVTVTKVEGDTVTIDANHELAGQTLHFDVKIDSVREATKDEIAALLSSDGGCGCGSSGSEGGCAPSDCSSCGGGCGC